MIGLAVGFGTQNQWQVARDLRERVKVAFDEAGVEIPFPHRVMVTADSN